MATDQEQLSGGAFHLRRGIREGVLFCILTIGVYLGIALATYDAADPGWTQVAADRGVSNRAGVAGAWFADVALFLFGTMAYLLPLALIAGGIFVYRRLGSEGSGNRPGYWGLRLTGLALTLLGGTSLAALHFSVPESPLPMNTGGLLGSFVAERAVDVFGFAGGTLLALAAFLIGITLLTGLSWLAVMDGIGSVTLNLLHATGGMLRRAGASWRNRPPREKKAPQGKSPAPPKARGRQERTLRRTEPSLSAPDTDAVATKPARKAPAKKDIDPTGDGSFPPPLALLDTPAAAPAAYSDAELEDLSRQVEEKLGNFGIEVEVTAARPGPVITCLDLQPAAGVKVSQISNLAKDLARELSVASVRVVEVVPGKSVVGLEIPNRERSVISLRAIFDTPAFRDAGSPVALALGQDIGGHPVVADLARMPHLLVAGTTGSGKSVGVNAMILSILYRATPEEVRMIMVDPKMLELSVYEGIPHLLAPVVTDMKDAANALRWCVAEMDRRYRLMAAVGVRNISGLNDKIRKAQAQGKPLQDPLAQVIEGEEAPSLTPLPYLVVVVDELADLMMVVGKKVEELIARLAQKARASGIHLVLATQRPSVDVITGLIKANIPTRISYQVSSKVDSRTILDQQGAEQLLGQGDMLYLPPGSGSPVRVHGAFVSDDEVHRVVAAVKNAGEPEYIDEILNGGSETAAGGGAELDDEADPLYDEAVKVVTETRKASVSGVQRRLKIGYNRAARLVEQMERSGVVGPLQSNGAREVLAPAPPGEH